MKDSDNREIIISIKETEQALALKGYAKNTKINVE